MALVTQIGVMMVIGFWLGYWLEEKTGIPYLKIILALLFAGASFYRLLKELEKDNES